MPAVCGRYVSPTMTEMERYWALSDAVRRNPFHGYEQHFNIAPTRAGADHFIQAMMVSNHTPLGSCLQ
jgi:hypothetical protein